MLLFYNMVSGVKKNTRTLLDAFLVKQVDILADIERFLIESSTDPTYNGTLRYFTSGLLDYQRGLNPIREQFESNMDDNDEMNISHWLITLDITYI